ncbi:hypothetical protein PMZ80_000467 [Knufia obscura]|uniref:Uncharacterized protein n=2 Tax=Knufia TaxID=430999 RepID=A0AAN8EIR2_9EURO|nr:hypothetical protein PMZ80_000467 [Knufia obscura]KAK5956604.1 hypothetical protein OHC33_002090 [Knufia fluminis]
MTIPSPIRRAEQHFLTELMPLMLEAGGITLNQIGEHRAEDMLQALNVMGTQSMTSAFDDENMEQSEKRIHMQGACYLLEVAVIYGNLESATRLLKFAANQGVQKLGVGINTNDAWQLVKANVADSRNPEECPWQAVSVYMEREFSLANLRSATPRARAWAIELLQYAGGQVLPGDEVESVHEWALFENPWSVLLGLVDQCLKYSLAVETYTRQQLQRLRLSCLRELTQYNDVAACFEVATRNEEFSSTEWVRMMTCAAADGQPDACWMLAIYYWQRDGLLATNEAQPRSGHVAKGKTSSPGFDWAEAALFAQQDRPPVLLSRAVASAALFRSLDDLESGSVLLQNIVSHIEHLNWVPLALRRRFETVLEDYRAKEDPAGIWAPQQCLSQIKRITDTSPEVTRNMGIPAEWLPKP